jgi:hypothetical protein
VSDKDDDYDFRREIERSMLYRGEYDKVLAGRAAGLKIFGVMVVIAAILCLLYKLVGIKMDGKGLMVAVGIIVVAGFSLVSMYANSASR